jgi:hypothetical protein
MPEFSTGSYTLLMTLDGIFQSLQIIAAYLFMKIHQLSYASSNNREAK